MLWSGVPWNLLTQGPHNKFHRSGGYGQLETGLEKDLLDIDKVSG